MTDGAEASGEDGVTGPGKKGRLAIEWQKTRPDSVLPLGERQGL